MTTTQRPNFDTMNVPTESTHDNTINTLLFKEDTESPEEFTLTIAEKDKEEDKREGLIVNLHNSDTIAHKTAIMRKIEYIIEIVYSNEKYTAPVIFGITLERKKNKINVFKIDKNLLTAMKIIDNTIKIIINKGKLFKHLDSFSEGQHFLRYFSSHNEVQKQRTFCLSFKLNYHLG